MTDRYENIRRALAMRPTPGPWVCYADVPSTDPNWHIVTNESRMRVLANVHIAQGSELDAANARLITAAPDLLEVLQELRESAEYWSEYDVPCGVVEKMDAALSKVYGMTANGALTALSETRGDTQPRTRKEGQPLYVTPIAAQATEIEALRAEALRELEEREQRDEALLRQALEALELRCGTNADERKELIPALRERLGVKA